MGYSAKIVLFLVIVAIAASPLSAQALLLPVHSERPASCHEHPDQIPSQPSSGHHCCLTGHDMAVLPAFYSPELVLQNVQPDVFASRIASASVNLPSQLFLSFGAPPGATPLRI